MKRYRVTFVMGVMTTSLPTAENLAVYENRDDIRAMRAGMRKAKHGT